MIIFLFGKPDVGKTTISLKLQEELKKIDCQAILLDAGELRKTSNSDLGFGAGDRIENHRRVCTLAKSLSDQGFVVIVNAINPYEAYRDRFYWIMEGDLTVVYLDASLETLTTRDTKGLYKDKVDNLTGVTDPFDPPSRYDIYLSTESLSVEECTDTILTRILPKLQPEIKQPSSMFIGRWQPFHKGHEWLIRQQLEAGKRILVGIRNMPTTESNPLTAYQTALCIKKIFPEDSVTVKVIPDIESFNYGRNVGYQVKEFIPEESVFFISGTGIRNSIHERSEVWKQMTNTSIHSLLLAWFGAI